MKIAIITCLFVILSLGITTLILDDKVQNLKNQLKTERQIDSLSTNNNLIFVITSIFNDVVTFSVYDATDIYEPSYTISYIESKINYRIGTTFVLKIRK